MYSVDIVVDTIAGNNKNNLQCIAICFSPGKQFQTFNVHQLLHLPEVVADVGPLWSNSCFPFEDYNGDLRDLFHGTKNVDGQVCSLCFSKKGV